MLSAAPFPIPTAEFGSFSVSGSTPTPMGSVSGSGSGSGSLFDASRSVLSRDSIGLAEARREFGLYGEGMRVAVIDTGADYTHPALGGRLGSGGVVIHGVDWTDGDNDPYTRADHGTGVTGVIASRDPNHPGIAPGAEVIALRVLDDNQRGTFQSIASALEWTRDNAAARGITAVNLSISDTKNYVTNWFATDGGSGQRIQSAVKALRDMGVAVVVGSGNSFTGNQGMSFSGIIKETVSVTGLGRDGNLLPKAQRLGEALGGEYATDIAAPAQDVMAPMNGNQFVPAEGTSFAAPIATGSILLLQQLYMSRVGTLPSVDYLEGLLRRTGDPVHDPATGITVPRLNLARAMRTLADENPDRSQPAPAPAPAPQPQIVAAPAPAPVPAPAPAPAPVATLTPRAIPGIDPAWTAPVSVPAPAPAPEPAPEPVVTLIPVTPAEPATAVTPVSTGGGAEEDSEGDEGSAADPLRNMRRSLRRFRLRAMLAGTSGESGSVSETGSGTAEPGGDGSTTPGAPTPNSVSEFFRSPRMVVRAWKPARDSG